jgi:hypothetical protein
LIDGLDILKIDWEVFYYHKWTLNGFASRELLVVDVCFVGPHVVFEVAIDIEVFGLEPDVL